jgi:transcriptional regulator with GAF, ATPase, and Fis domain
VHAPRRPPLLAAGVVGYAFGLRVELQEVVELAKVLVAEDDAGPTAEAVFRALLDLCGADRGLLVVREGDSYEERGAFRFDRADVSSDDRRFSRSVVRRAIETGSVIASNEALRDPRLAGTESLERMGACAVLVVPLQALGEVYGVVYLDQLTPRGGFSDEVVKLTTALCELAGLAFRRALERESAARRLSDLERDLLARHDFAGIVTEDASMLRLLGTLAQVADSDASVVVCGETGTGKELVARALHLNSPRRKKPFVAIHCTALPATILESELFGHCRGAFTGADRDRVGRIASASGGTLFLDEVAEIPAEVQSKLLRFIQFGEIQRLGSDRTETVDVRVVAATHRDIPAMVASGTFRQDLWYRLKVVELQLPPLRERKGDIPLLVATMLERRWKRGGRAQLTQRALAALGRYDFPGNVRELEHIVERACVLATGREIDVDLLPPEVLGGAPATGEDTVHEYTASELERVREAASANAERSFLSALLKQNGGNISAASRSSGIHRSYLQRLMTKHGLRHG